MQEKYRPFERIERPIEPPEEPTIPPGIDGYYDERSDVFIADSEAFEEALENWDLMSKQKREVFKRFLIDLYFEDWERVKGE
ncbi:MAG: hypothetical protein LUC17_00660 [Oscillospiraceae bacterium]|nr:hypothetical protein [Oscillospiraceae bacterium]